MSTSIVEQMALHAANPLLEPLGPYVETREGWIKILANNPLKNVDRGSLTQEQRIMLLEDLKSKFVPTRQGLDVTADLQDMMRASLRARNPLLVEARIRQNGLLATISGTGRLVSVPWFNTPLHGKMISGVTGLGKTHPVQRFIDLLPRVYVHGPGKVPGWMKTTQIVTLYVKMTHDGYRGGFLQAILIEVDQLCGTDYSTQYRKERVEILAVRVGQILISHCVGLLVIDDIQVKNFTLSPDRDALLLLFLKILDFGIPVVLIGSPLAFLDIESFSQDNRRLTTSEPQEYMPFDSLENSDWGEGLIPGLWNHNLMQIQTPQTDNIKKTLNFNSAGFPHYLMVIAVGVQKYAIRRGLKQVTEPVLAEYLGQSKTLARAQTLLQGFRERDPFLLSAIEDVPWQEYGVRWGKIKPEDVADSDSGLQPTGKSGKAKKWTRETRLMSLQQRAARRYLGERARSQKKETANQSLGKGLSSGDFRGQGLAQAHVDGLRKLQTKMESA